MLWAEGLAGEEGGRGVEGQGERGRGIGKGIQLYHQLLNGGIKRLANIIFLNEKQASIYM